MLSPTETLMSTHDAIARPYLTEAWALVCERQEVENLEMSIRERMVIPIYSFDGNIIYSYQMAALMQYRSTEMWCVYFAGEESRKPTGTILRISKIRPGDM